MEFTPAVVPLPSIEGVQAAAEAIDPTFTNTVLAENELLDRVLGCHLAAKVETLNPIRSFKGRGASWFMTCLDGDAQPLVTASVGNFGQGLAYAARSAATPLTVFAATTANPVKTEAMAALGAKMIQVGADFDEAKSAAAELAEREQALLVVDGAEPRISEGAGTIALELTHQWTGKPMDAVLVPMGNGGLVNGVGTWLQAQWPTTQVIAVAAEGAPAMARSWSAGYPIEGGATDTIADGLAVRVPIPYALDVMKRTVDDVVTVADASIIEAMALVHRHLGIVVEPAGAAGVAAILQYPRRFRTLTVGTILCGGNVSHDVFAKWLQTAARHD